MTKNDEIKLKLIFIMDEIHDKLLVALKKCKYDEIDMFKTEVEFVTNLIIDISVEDNPNFAGIQVYQKLVNLDKQKKYNDYIWKVNEIYENYFKDIQLII